MALSNFERMLLMAEEIFDAHNDSRQLQVDEKVIAQLYRLHPASVTELDEGEGPVVWILLIPTTKKLMNDFVNEKISEQDLLVKTLPGVLYEALYLCSAMVLPEYRKKGLAQELTLKAIKSIRKKHPVAALFVWSFTQAGERLAEKIANECKLKLLKRKGKQTEQK